jgi:type III secretion protein R
VRRLGYLAALAPALAWARPYPRELLEDSFAGRPVSMMAVMAVMAVLPFAAVMLTSFSKIAVVLSICRTALGTQQAPPTVVLTGLAAVLSGHIMAPVLEAMWAVGQVAYAEVGTGGQMISAVSEVAQPLRDFLLRHGGPEERAQFVEMARALRPVEQAHLVAETDLWVVVPAFVITELKEAFQIGFLIFLPFLVLDMVIANVLLALGMQTLSPSQVSLPFKILLFVAVDGWVLLSKGLILGYGGLS